RAEPAFAAPQVEAGEPLHLRLTRAVGLPDLVELDQCGITHDAERAQAEGFGAMSARAGVPALSEPSSTVTAVTFPSVGPVTTSIGIGLLSSRIQIRGWPLAGGGGRGAPGGGGSRKKLPRPPVGCDSAGGVNRSAALGTSNVSGIVVTTTSAVAVIPGCTRPALLSTLRIVSYVTTLFDVFGVLRISETRDSNGLVGYASTRKVADCPTRT